MILLVDAGNTRIKWRLVEDRVLLAAGTVPTPEVQELAAAWRPFGIKRAVLSCVADTQVRAGLAEILAVTDTAVQWLVAERENYGLINHYQKPEKLGSDRYAALIAAARLKLGECVVACVGTATTVDRLDSHGAFLGGIILPGPELMRTALVGGTSQIECRMQSDDAQPDAAGSWMPPRNTRWAVSTGIALAQAGAIHSMCQPMPEADDRIPLLILTGGGRDQVRDWLHIERIEIEDLVLDGLAWIALEKPWAN